MGRTQLEVIIEEWSDGRVWSLVVT